MEPLENILLQMQEQRDNGDQEQRHVNADNLLLDIVDMIIDGKVFTSADRFILRDIVVAYQSLDFWYA